MQNNIRLFIGTRVESFLQTVKCLIEPIATSIAHGLKWVKYHLHFSGLERLKNTPDILK